MDLPRRSFFLKFFLSGRMKDYPGDHLNLRELLWEGLQLYSSQKKICICVRDKCPSWFLTHLRESITKNIFEHEWIPYKSHLRNVKIYAGLGFSRNFRPTPRNRKFSRRNRLRFRNSKLFDTGVDEKQCFTWRLVIFFMVLDVRQTTLAASLTPHAFKTVSRPVSKNFQNR